MNRMNKAVSILASVSWTLAICGYFFQFPFPKMASLIVPCILGYIVLQMPNWRIYKNNKYLIGLGIYFVVIVVAATRSLETGVALGRVARFAAVLSILPVCCWIKDPDYAVKNKIFTYLAVIKSLILIGIAVCVAIQGDFTGWRNWAWTNGMGDIYFFTRWFPKVQVQGNALLVVAFMAETAKNNRLTVKSALVLGGVLAAGNFAYILGIGLFLIFELSEPIYRKIENGQISKRTLAFLLAICVLITVPYLVSKYQQKVEISNKVRLEQISVLLDANLFLGEGLGSIVRAETSTRVYDGDIYFEMQTLYILNQIGIVGLLLVYVLTFYPLLKTGKRGFMMYLVYLAYSFWNPYCWDTTHMIVLILIFNLGGFGEKYDKSHYYSLLSPERCIIQCS